MARPTLTDLGVAKLKPKDKRYNYADPNLPGHYVRVTPTGAKTFAAIVRNPSGKQELITIGDAATLPISEARARARVAMQRVKDGLSAFPPPAASFGAIAADWLKRKAEAEDFRSLPEIRRQLEKNILPRMDRSGNHRHRQERDRRAARQDPRSERRAPSGLVSDGHPHDPAVARQPRRRLQPAAIYRHASPIAEEATPLAYARRSRDTQGVGGR